jgi:hypothetical protein
MRACDPTDPRNVTTLLLFRMAVMSEECASQSSFTPLRDALSSMARDPAFRQFTQVLVPDGGAVGLLNARSGLELARDEIAAARDLLADLARDANPAGPASPK